MNWFCKYIVNKKRGKVIYKNKGIIYYKYMNIVSVIVCWLCYSVRIML